MTAEPQTPGRTGYYIAGIIFVAGVVITGALIAWIIVNLLDMNDSFERIVVPGATEVELNDTGRYTVFYEYRSSVQGRDFDTGEDVPNLELRVTSVESSREIPISSSFADMNYNFFSRAGESIATFHINEPGTYEISAEYVGGQDGPQVVLAFAEGVGTSVALMVGAGIGSGFVFCAGLLIALLVLAITLYRRSNTQRSISQQPPYSTSPTRDAGT